MFFVCFCRISVRFVYMKTTTSLLLIIFLALGFTSCSSDEDFKKGSKQLIQQGYTDIRNTGYKAFCCGKDDTFKTGFSAKNNKGETVEGCFCSAALKGITVRFE